MGRNHNCAAGLGITIQGICGRRTVTGTTQRTETTISASGVGGMQGVFGRNARIVRPANPAGRASLLPGSSPGLAASRAEHQPRAGFVVRVHAVKLSRPCKRG
jgi:hypothetical protein